MMPDTTGCWPDLGEMDILEMINGDGRVHATYHWDANYPAKNCSQVRQQPPAPAQTTITVELDYTPRACRGVQMWHFAFDLPAQCDYVIMCVFERGRFTPVLQPDGHKMHGSHIKITTWD